MNIEEKYKIAIETLQAISTRGTVAETDPYRNEWTEAAAMRDMDYAATKCLKRLGESVLLPSYIEAHKGIIHAHLSDII